MKAAVLFVLATFLIQNQAAPIETRSLLTGDGTFYQVGLGSCGKESSDSDMVAALSSELMGDKKYCGKKITVKSKKGSVKLKVVDTCPSCSKGDVDMSSAAFKKLGSLDSGRIDISWSL
ncbi:hypothetical protein G6F56_003602 [Rhizopus delemar]|uniref:RlpA-like protein double-psi beta-barrel domain-containing protein n=1 Tax=Rhizopus stolonifer TaxID=4846 RepID=A0A367J5K2_RHIST|nr:hypothetical protein G6F56_003602 [Rhizopus delemar]RCH85227.1 hypothetical protein CU098_008895 [Rhizopus stolonifer]